MLFDIDVPDYQIDPPAEEEEQDETFYDEAMDFAMEMERDLYDRD